MWRTRLRVVALLLVTSAAVAVPGTAHAVVNSQTALIYGDSLTLESARTIRADFASERGWTQVIRGYPGTAPCDWLTTLASDLVTYHPTVVSLETAGNNFTACTYDASGNPQPFDSPGLLERYQADLAQFMAEVTATGAKFVYVNAPPMGSPDNPTMNQGVTDVNAIARTLAGEYHGVSIANAPRAAVSIHGRYTAYTDCLLTEGAARGCVGGKIAIRTLSGTQAGIHFCPGGLPTSWPLLCATYSSGEFRWSRALVEQITNPPKPITPVAPQVVDPYLPTPRPGTSPS